MRGDVIIDTSVLIDALRGRSAAGAFVDSACKAGRAVVTAPVAAELLDGVQSARELRTLRALLRSMKGVVPREPDWVLALQWVGTYRLAHGVDWVDCLVGATARRMGVPVATQNVKHFELLPGVTVVQPY